MDNSKQKINVNPRENANFLSVIFFTFFFPVFKKGYKKDLDIDDIYDPLLNDRSSKLGDTLERNWNEHLENCRKKGKTPSFTKIVFKTFWKDVLITGLLLFLFELITNLSQPIFLGFILLYFSSEPSITQNQAILYASCMLLINFIGLFFENHHTLTSLHMGLRVRVATCSLIYRKSLKLSKTVLSEVASGKVVNLLSNDVSRFDVGLIFLHYMWISPIAVIIIIVIMWFRVGYPGLIGMASLFLIVPLQVFIGRLSSKYRFQTASKTDDRVRETEDIMSGIQVIKMYAWEKPFIAAMNYLRQLELNKIIKAAYIRGISVTFSLFTTRFALFITIISMVAFDEDLTADKIFVLASYFNILSVTISNSFVRGISEIAEVKIALNRLQTFLLYEEHESYKNKLQSTDNSNLNNAIELNNLTAKWNPSSSNNTIENISIAVPKGCLVGVIGSVGCGKSSLLQVLLEELTVTQGTININGTVSYACQEAWIFVASVRQNILFGEPYNQIKYNNVVNVCALRADFEQFSNGDMTIVGDRGVSLSGGQKARINLARAIYRDADIYLLDDPLSAVDTHVGKHLFERCIIEYLKSKTVVLVTHQIQYLKNIELIILLKEGRLENMGTFKDVVNSNSKYAEILIKEDETNEIVMIDDEKQIEKKLSILSSISEDDSNSNEILKEQLLELSSKGSVKGNLFVRYISSGGNAFLVIFVGAMFLLAQFSASSTDYWVSFWINQEDLRNNEEEVKHSTEVYKYIYTGLVLSIIIFAMFRSISFYYLTLRCSKIMHTNMFTTIIKAPMKFFNINPTGRILSRFSKDMGVIDELLPRMIIDSIQMILIASGAVILASVVNPYFLIVVAILLVVIICYRRVYLRTSKNLKRIDGITRSPVFVHLNATLQGLTTIRAFGAQNVLKKEFDKHQDLHSGAWFMFISGSTTFGFTLDFLCFLFIFIVTFTFVLEGQTASGDAALAITQAMSLTVIIQFALRNITEVENQLMAAERILEYTWIKPETNWESIIKPSVNWLHSGRIIFQNTYLKYDDSGPYVLKNLNLNIKPKEKIGIVGRTGAGKSSLIASLFRLTEINGDIIIDEMNIKDIGLQDLRSKISIIPQDPVLFSGTLRKNLDPFDEYSDFMIWSALEDVQLKKSEEMDNLDMKVMDRGSNFSFGQKQLICLARAILRNNKVLVLDEATANVDLQTDKLIQTTIREKFADCTVLTVAHRLNTIMDSDKVLVMDAGNMVQFDHPHILCQDINGHFYKMVAETGSAMAEQLYEIAKQDYESKYNKLTTL